MAKKIVRAQAHAQPEFSLRHIMLFLFMAFLAALGLAAVVQGLILQWSFGFKYGFFSYLLAFIFLGVAKHIKWKLFSQMHPDWCK